MICLGLTCFSRRFAPYGRSTPSLVARIRLGNKPPFSVTGNSVQYSWHASKSTASFAGSYRCHFRHAVDRGSENPGRKRHKLKPKHLPGPCMRTQRLRRAPRHPKRKGSGGALYGVQVQVRVRRGGLMSWRDVMAETDAGESSGAAML